MQVNTHQSFHPQIRVSSDTTLAKFNLNWEQAARLANQHTLAVQRFLSTRSPQAKLFRGRGVVGCLSGIKAPFLNLSLEADYPAEMRLEEIEADIEALHQFYQDHEMGNCWQWLISPFATPANIEALLIARGFGQIKYRLPCLMASLKDTSGWPGIPQNVTIWPARHIEDLKAATRIRRTALQEPGRVASSYFEDTPDSWLGNDQVRLFLGRVGDDGPPAAIGILIMAKGIPGVYVMATLPEWEHQGLGRSILARILQEAIRRGYDRAVLTAGARAYSLYRKFGFEHLFEYQRFWIKV